MKNISEKIYSLLTENPCEFPISFCLSGERFEGFDADRFIITDRKHCETQEKISDTLFFSFSDTLNIVWKAEYWKEYGASEWTVYFENCGKSDSPVISELYCLKHSFEGENPVLKGILGDHKNFYRPYEKELCGQEISFESLGGRPTHVVFPYFNLEYGGGGVLMALGWAGTWSAEFKADEVSAKVSARSTVGLSAALKPGEKIRTALTVLLPYGKRDEDYAMNLWRRWFINCNMPKADAQGSSVKPFSACCLASDTGLPNSDGSISERSTTWRRSLEKMYEVGAKTDFRWFDAGWYCDPEGNTVESDWWGTVGSWELDKVKWPGDSFKESVDFAHKNGMKTLMWFEPERVTSPESLAKNFGYNTDWAIRMPGSNQIANNIGNCDCLRWTQDRIIKALTENSVDMYREDNNFDSGALWRYLDGLDGRKGITECKAVVAHYDMWDNIIEATKSNGGCAFCDSCASGGGRNDLESLRRGIPLLRSDYDRTTTALRLSMTSSFNKWVPFCGANTKEKVGQLDATGRSDVYTWRASYLPVLNVDSQFVQDENQDFDMLVFGLNEWKRINEYLLKDFYVLTDWHDEKTKDDFTAYCYYCPEEGKGVLFVFRQEECKKDEFAVTLKFLNKGSAVLTDADSSEETEYREGMKIFLPEKRSARLFYIEEKN